MFPNSVALPGGAGLVLTGVTGVTGQGWDTDTPGTEMGFPSFSLHSLNF